MSKSFQYDRNRAFHQGWDIRSETGFGTSEHYFETPRDRETFPVASRSIQQNREALILSIIPPPQKKIEQNAILIGISD